MSHTDRIHDLRRFYSSLALLEERLGGQHLLGQCTGRMPWPRRGVYFFMEPGETRTDTGSGPRIVRVGTHALKSGSGTSLWNRLSQHRGVVRTGGGNHRGSIFRLIVGAALMERDHCRCPTWSDGSSAPAEIRAQEIGLEQVVSKEIGRMPFVWLGIEDEPGPGSLRGLIERNAIALLSNFGKPALDPPSREWLGHYSDRPRVRQSGLWNSNHVDEPYDPGFLDQLEQLVSEVVP